jgi:hypothetical protein
MTSSRCRKGNILDTTETRNLKFKPLELGSMLKLLNMAPGKRPYARSLDLGFGRTEK